MCRVFGAASKVPISVRHELISAPNPMIRQSEEHDSGWGLAVYEGADGRPPRHLRFPVAAYEDPDFQWATDVRGRIFNVHVRRATMGGLATENTHPFCLANYSFSHNGTIWEFPNLRGPGIPKAKGQTDSEHFFCLLISEFDPGDASGSLRRAVRQVIERSPFSSLNFLFSDGELLYAYKLGVFDLHWLPGDGQVLVSTERLDDETWHHVQQDVLLTFDPSNPEEPHAERLLGDSLVARAKVVDSQEGAELTGEARGRFAQRRAARLAEGSVSHE
jgi:predicted glutamine amidotransferase